MIGRARRTRRHGGSHLSFCTASDANAGFVDPASIPLRTPVTRIRAIIVEGLAITLWVEFVNERFVVGHL